MKGYTKALLWFSGAVVALLFVIPREVGFIEATATVVPTNTVVRQARVQATAAVRVTPRATPLPVIPAKPPFEQGCTMLFTQQCEGYSISTFACGNFVSEDLTTYNCSEFLSNWGLPGGYKMAIHDGVVSLSKGETLARGTFGHRWLKVVMKTTKGEIIMRLAEERGITYQAIPPK